MNSTSSWQIKSLPLLFLFDSSIEDGLTKETIRFKILIASIVKVKLQNRETKLLLIYSLFIHHTAISRFLSFLLFEVFSILILFCRTFLNTAEIVVICVFSVIIVFALIFWCIYYYYFGCVVHPKCRRRDKDYTKIQLERERKIGELWKHNMQQTDQLQRVNDDCTILP